MRSGLGILMALFSSLAQANWTSVVDKDDFTDEELRYVIFENEVIRIQFNIDELVFIVRSEEISRSDSLFAYVTATEGLFHPNTPIEFRVDDHPTQKVEPLDATSDMFMNLYSWSPTTLKVLFLRPTHGDGVCVDHAKNFFSGSILRGRYHTDSMSRESFAISLDGMREAFAEAFGGNPEINACLEQTE